MNKSWGTRQLTEFVRDILGCGCPDRVFENIEVSRVKKGVFPLDTTRINVGDTLLIYIVRPRSSEELQDAIKEIISGGRDDRDVHGFNRFRLVVAGDELKLNPDMVAGIFAEEIGRDEKMHIHFVRAELVSGL